MLNRVIETIINKKIEKKRKLQLEMISYNIVEQV